MVFKIKGTDTIKNIIFEVIKMATHDEMFRQLIGARERFECFCLMANLDKVTRWIVKKLIKWRMRKFSSLYLRLVGYWVEIGYADRTRFRVVKDDKLIREYRYPEWLL